MNGNVRGAQDFFTHLILQVSLARLCHGGLRIICMHGSLYFLLSESLHIFTKRLLQHDRLLVFFKFFCNFVNLSLKCEKCEVMRLKVGKLLTGIVNCVPVNRIRKNMSLAKLVQSEFLKTEHKFVNIFSQKNHSGITI